MFKRARISLLIALVAATCGFLGLLDSPIAQTLFDFLLAFAFLSFLFGLFEDQRQTDSSVRDPVLQTRRITAGEPKPTHVVTTDLERLIDHSRRGDEALTGSAFHNWGLVTFGCDGVLDAPDPLAIFPNGLDRSEVA